MFTYDYQQQGTGEGVPFLIRRQPERCTGGPKKYVKWNHLGNVLATVTDQKQAVDDNGDVDYWKPTVVSYSDYYPFGSIMPGRSFNSGSYRYAYNGKEQDPEVSGTGNSYDYGFRIYNPRLGRFLSVDPLAKSFPFYTPYQFAANMPIAAIDLDGLEAVITINSPWYQNEIEKAVNDGDVQRAAYLASKAIGDPAKNEYAKELYGSDYAGTFNHSEDNPEGLTVMNSNGDVLFNMKQMSPQKQQQGKVAEESSGSWYDPILEWLGMADDALSGSGEKTDHEGGGIMFTSTNGQGQETRVAVDPSKVDGPINIDLLLATFGATKAASGGPAKNVAEAAGRLIDAYQTGKDAGDALGTESPWGGSNETIYKCKACDGTFRDSSGTFVPAEGTPTEEIDTHY